MRFSAGTRTSVKKTSLKPESPAMLRIGRTSMPGRSMGTMKYEMPRCFETSPRVRAMRMPNRAWSASDVQIFWPFDAVDVAVALGAGGEVREIGARAGLAEELAPQLLAREHRPQVALLLLVVTQRDDDRSAVPDTDRVERFGDAGAPHLALDDQLQRGVGVEPVRTRPVRHDEARVDQIARTRRGMLCEPAPHLDAARVVLGGRSTSTAAVSHSSCPRCSTSPMAWNIADLIEHIVDTRPRPGRAHRRRRTPHLRPARGAGQSAGPPPRRPRASAPATMSGSTA